ncbi:MAG: dihydropteroate synthase [Gammaproteobacteria bacterium]|nr:dihydropteroate synthase [Gammaproteobacteria bacterium]TVQ43478.1 MAG: dihydropteroate synthase [Gammaproteobacteria bacterium]
MTVVPQKWQLRCADHLLDLSSPRLMGVLNVTPDSFSDGGRFLDPGLAAARAIEMVAQGAAIIDIGGESTRPGAPPVPLEEERKRVLPVLRRLVRELPVPVSVDTLKPALMREAVDAGAGLINDVNALRAPGALEAVAASDAAVCLMHMQGQPRTMQAAPEYADVVSEVSAFLAHRVALCEAAGIGRDRLLLDPGFGFGKLDAHNLALLRGLSSLCASGLPVLAGLSRKSLIGRLLGREVSQRLAGSLALALAAVARGARVLRVHDVAETADALALWRLVGVSQTQEEDT